MASPRSKLGVAAASPRAYNNAASSTSSAVPPLPFLPSGSPRIAITGSARNDEWLLKQSKARDKEAIASARAFADTRKPVQQYPHLKNNAKRKMKEAQERARIERENQLLHERLEARARGKYQSEYRDRGQDERVQYQLKMRRKMRALNLEKVRAENVAMVARIRSAQDQAVAEQEAIDEDWREKVILLRRIAHHPLILGEESHSARGGAPAAKADGNGRDQLPTSRCRPSASNHEGRRDYSDNYDAGALHRVAWDADVHVPRTIGRHRYS